jgi:hypothetical protein
MPEPEFRAFGWYGRIECAEEPPAAFAGSLAWLPMAGSLAKEVLKFRY